MLTRIGKLVVILCVGLALVWQVVAVGDTRVTPATAQAVSCCSHGCGNCDSTSCCARPGENNAPRSPVPAPSSQENHLQAPAPAQHATLAAPEFTSHLPLPAALAAVQDETVPIFQRNCSFLI